MALLPHILRKKLDRTARLTVAFQRLFHDDKNQVTAEAIIALGFLRGFCFANASTIMYGKDGHADPYASAAAAGRQEVWTQISFYLSLQPAELAEIEREFKRQLEEMRDAG